MEPLRNNYRLCCVCTRGGVRDTRYDTVSEEPITVAVSVYPPSPSAHPGERDWLTNQPACVCVSERPTLKAAKLVVLVLGIFGKKYPLGITVILRAGFFVYQNPVYPEKFSGLRQVKRLAGV